MARVMIYAVGVAGVGHLRRAVRIAEHLDYAQAGSDILVVSAHASAARLFQQAACHLVSPAEIGQLLGRESSPDHAAATETLRSLIADFSPDVFVSTTHAGVRGEVSPLLSELAASGRRRVLALRDIYWPARFQSEFAALGPEDFDEVLVAAPDLSTSLLPLGLLESRLAEHTRYVGYLRPIERMSAMPGGTPDIAVWCQAGGGRDGYDLAAKFLEVAPALAAERPEAALSLTCGVLMSQGSKVRLAPLAASAGVDLQEWTVDPYESNWSSAKRPIMLSMAGYNSCVEAAWFGFSTLICPRQAVDEHEQSIRAELFSQDFSNIRSLTMPAPEQILSVLLDPPPQAQVELRKEGFASPGAVADVVLGRVSHREPVR